MDEIWSVDVPDEAVDLRGVPPEDRYDRVKRAFEGLDSGEQFYLVSDRDPTPVREYLLDIVDSNGELEHFEVRRQNPETWVVRTVHP
jgi:ATP-binding protein involved in chromosome partitioning